MLDAEGRSPERYSRNEHSPEVHVLATETISYFESEFFVFVQNPSVVNPRVFLLSADVGLI